MVRRFSRSAVIAVMAVAGAVVPVGGGASAAAAPVPDLGVVQVLASSAAPGSSAVYSLTFTLPSDGPSPSLVAIAMPGATFPVTSDALSPNAFHQATCASPAGQPACTVDDSLWGTVQTGVSGLVLNLAGPGGTLGAGDTITLTIGRTGYGAGYEVTNPSGSGTFPVSVAWESAPGVLLAQGSTAVTVGGSALATLGVGAAGADPNSAGYPDASWTVPVSGLSVASGATAAIEIAAPGAAFPLGNAAYSVTGVSCSPACSSVGLSVDTARSSGAAGLPAVLDVTPVGGTLASLTLVVSGVTNPAGPAAGSVDVTVSSGPRGGPVGGIGTAPLPLSFVASPFVGLASNHTPVFPSATRDGVPTLFGVNVSNTSDHVWPAGSAGLGFVFSGIPALGPGDVTLRCVSESNGSSFSPQVVAGTAPGTLETIVEPIAVGTGVAAELDCTLTVVPGSASGTLDVGAVLTDLTRGPSAPIQLSRSDASLQVVPGPMLGYWLAGAGGVVTPFGSATYHGSMGGKPLDAPIVGMAADPAGTGYWLVAADGGVFAFGSATYHGSMGGKPLDAPIVGMAADPAGTGYWLVAADGGVFAFGTATFEGSEGAGPVAAPVVGIATWDLPVT